MRLVLDGAKSFGPGELVAGVVAIDSHEEVDPALVTVELRLENRFNEVRALGQTLSMLGAHETGDASTCKASTSALTVARSTLLSESPRGAGKYRFELLVPHDGPPSAYDKELPEELRHLVSWEVRVSPADSGGPDDALRETIRVCSYSGQYAEWSNEQPVIKASRCPIRVSLERRVVRPGESVSGTLVLAPNHTIKAGAVGVRLERRRHRTQAAPGAAPPGEALTNRGAWNREVVWNLSGPRILEAEVDQSHYYKTYEIPFEITVPEDAPPSFLAKNNELHWHVVGFVTAKRLSLTAGDEYRGELEIVVYSGEDAEAPAFVGGLHGSGEDAEAPAFARELHGSGEDPRVIVDRFGPRLDPGVGVFRTPNIPEKRLANALRTYGGALNPEDVLVLVDNTVFGSGKRGALLTETALLTHVLKAPIDYAEIRSVGLSGPDLRGLVVDGQPVLEGLLISKACRDQFVLLLEALAAAASRRG